MPPDGDVSGVSQAVPAPEVPSWDEEVRRSTAPGPGLETAASSAVRRWSIVLAAGVLAGLAGFGVGEAAPRLSPPDLNLPAEIRASGTKKPAEIERRMGIARDRAAALAYGGMGMLLGLALGVAGGLVRRSPVAAATAGLVGLVLGAAAGAGTTQASLPSYHAARAAAGDEDKNNDLALALMTHGAIWAAVGAAAGLALGLGLGGRGRAARAVVGGLLGACVAAGIYEFAGAIMFPTDQTFRPVAISAMPRLLAHISVALWAAVGAFGLADYLTIGPGKAAGSRG
jgi:hypothetical protein